MKLKRVVSQFLDRGVNSVRGKKIQERRDSKTISVGRALNLLDQSGEKVLDEFDKLSLIALSNVRDAAQHSVVRMSEHELYLHAQAAVTVFARLLKAEFDRSLADYLPQRVLPISTDPPTSLELLVDREVTQIRHLQARISRR